MGKQTESAKIQKKTIVYIQKGRGGKFFQERDGGTRELPLEEF
jgi:hypothetical protein